MKMKKNQWAKKVCCVFAMLLLPVPLFGATSEESGIIKIDGSSTVYPITEAVAEEFGSKNRKAKITVGISGTGGGFKKFCRGEIDISDASRPIKKTEIQLCAKNGIDYVEIPVAYDALSIVVNPQNTWATSLTVAELKKIWEPAAQEKIMNWNQVRASFPDKPLVLYGPGVDSGTYDYFTEAVVGKEHASRGDFTSSEDDNVLVQGIATDVNALGFFGLAYYAENTDKLKAVGVDDEEDSNGKGPQLPSIENVVSSLYQPLARPLFIYVSKASLKKQNVKAFVEFYLQQSAELATEVGYVRLPDDIQVLAQKRLDAQTIGSIFAEGGTQVGVSIADLMRKSS